MFKIQQLFSRINSLGKGVLDLFSLPPPTKHFIRSYNEAGLLWNRSFKNCSHGYIHRMMAAQSKKETETKVNPSKFRHQTCTFKPEEELSVKHTDLWKPTTTANPKSSYPHTHLPNPNTSLSSRRMKSTLLGTRGSYGLSYSCAAQTSSNTILSLSPSTYFSWFGLQMARETMLAYDKLIVLRYIPF